jgi:hypothetical protein
VVLMSGGKLGVWDRIFAAITPDAWGVRGVD